MSDEILHVSDDEFAHTPIFELIEEENASEEGRQSYQDIQARYGGRLPDI